MLSLSTRSHDAPRAASRYGLAPVALALTLALAVGGELAAPREVSAQTTSGAAARALFAEGNRLFAASQRAAGERSRELAEQALAAYVQSLGLVRSRNAVYNAAMVLVALERPAEAWAYLSEYLADPEVTDAEREDASQRRDALEEEIALVRVESSPPGAAVTLIGSTPIPLGEAPVEIPLPPGEHELALRLPGHEEATRTLSLAAGDQRDVMVPLAPVLVPLTVRVASTHPGDGDGGAALTIDGEPAAPGLLALPPGTHELALTHTDGREARATVELAIGDAAREVTLELPAPPEPEPSTEPRDVQADDEETAVDAAELVGDRPSATAPRLSLRRAGATLLSIGAAAGLGAFALRLRSGTLNDRHRALQTANPDAAMVARARAIARDIDRVNAWGRGLTALAALTSGVGFVLLLRGRGADEDSTGDGGASARLRIGLGSAQLSVRFDGLRGGARR